jgi:hypothetical protein
MRHSPGFVNRAVLTFIFLTLFINGAGPTVAVESTIRGSIINRKPAAPSRLIGRVDLKPGENLDSGMAGS